MTEDELEMLLTESPTLFHVAHEGSWPSIRERGLLSTSALLDLYHISGRRRTSIESERRSQSFLLTADDLPGAVIRDQLPMDDRGLLRALPRSIAPRQWYQLLNSRVFFWLDRGRVTRLLGAAAYRRGSHDLLEIDSRKLVMAYKNAIWLSPMNSGCTKPFPHPRDENTFSRIDRYPYAKWRSKRKRGERVVELCVDTSVPDVARFVTRVARIVEGTEEATLFSRD